MERSVCHNAVAAAAVGVLGFLVSCVAPKAYGAAQPTAELLDLAGRIEYGFYTREARAIETAQSRLSRLPGNGALKHYYAGLGAYRAALLRATSDGRDLGPVLEDCMARGRHAAGDDELAGEAWILVAACAVLGARHQPSKSRLYQNRYEAAVNEALAADASNPRILVVGAWAISLRPAHEAPELRERARERLQQAVAQFALWSGPFGFPDWGEAEALAHLGEIELELGNARAARDFVEQALLVAPDYRFALSLLDRIR